MMNGNSNHGIPELQSPVVLTVDFVRCRDGDKSHKNPGQLYIAEDSLLWTDGNGVKILHHYKNIKTQKVSPEAKPKVQLQIILHDSKTCTFQYLNEKGHGKQLEERNAVKDILSQRLPKFKQGAAAQNGADIPSTSSGTGSQNGTSAAKSTQKGPSNDKSSIAAQKTRMKEKMLKEDKELFEVYKQLVVTKLISDEDFWSNFGDKDLLEKPEQKVGISPGFLSDARKSDGCNRVTFNLSRDTIEAIFATYPAVKKKHLECVPEMSEKDFWTKFFQSHYFHRDRTLNLSPEDFFADCVTIDEKDMAAQLSKPITEGNLDLKVIEDKHFVAEDEDDEGPRSNPAHAKLLKKFNHQSTKVLEACLGPGTQSSSGSKSVGSSLPQTSAVHQSEPSTSTEPALKKRRLLGPNSMESAELGDTESPFPDAALVLSNVEKYMQLQGSSAEQAGSTSHDNSGTGDAGCSPEEQRRLMEVLRENVAGSSGAESFDPDVSHDILIKLSSGGAWFKSEKIDWNATIPKQVRDEIRSTYLATAELMRHFWLCFPTAGKSDREQKVERMSATLKKFEETKVKTVSDMLARTRVPDSALQHIRRMLRTANDKYDEWSTARNRKKMIKKPTK